MPPDLLRQMNAAADVHQSMADRRPWIIATQVPPFLASTSWGVFLGLQSQSHSKYDANPRCSSPSASTRRSEHCKDSS